METAIIKQENVELIVRNAPLSYQENLISHDRCIEYGQTLLDTIGGGQMTDELDQKAADYIERAKKTVKKMNEKRSPVTRLFDEIRTVYTGLENDIDPSRPGSIPAQFTRRSGLIPLFVKKVQSSVHPSLFPTSNSR